MIGFTITPASGNDLLVRVVGDKPSADVRIRKMGNEWRAATRDANGRCLTSTDFVTICHLATGALDAR
jgi:hypothetical protein